MAERAKTSRTSTRDDSATIASRIAELLRDDIVQGSLSGGQRLNEVALAKQYGVSRIPLREALRILEGQGLVEIRPFGGAFAAELSAEEAEDIFEIFEALEAVALRLVFPNLTTSDLQLAEHQARKAEREPDPRRWLEHVGELYATIYGGVERRHLWEMLRRVTLNESRYLFALFAAVHTQRPGIPGPRDFVKVLRKRDLEVALTFQRDWRRAQREFIVRHLRERSTPRVEEVKMPTRSGAKRTKK